MRRERWFPFVLGRLRCSMAVVLALSGCLQYVPANVTPLPRPETQVRLTLARPLDAEMGEFTIHDVTRVEGIVTAVNGDSLVLEASWLYAGTRRNKYDALARLYRIPLAQVQQFEQLRLSPKRTVIALGAAAIALAILLDLTELGPGGGIEPPPPPEDGPIARRR